MSQTIQPRRRNAGKPGELLLGCALLCLAAPPLVVAIVHSEDAENAALLAQGVVAQARITAHDERVEHYTGRRGRPKTRNHQFLIVDFDANAATPYARWQASGQLDPAPYPATVSHEIEVSEAYFATNPVGSSRPLVFVRGDLASADLVERLQFESSWTYHLWHYLILGPVFIAGLVMARMGWRKRFARG